MPSHPPSPTPPGVPIPYPNTGSIGANTSTKTGSNWILFFDEADALFGKRTEVRSSHDRF